jgi:hypothetical protein
MDEYVWAGRCTMMKGKTAWNRAEEKKENKLEAKKNGRET